MNSRLTVNVMCDSSIIITKNNFVDVLVTVFLSRVKVHLTAILMVYMLLPCMSICDSIFSDDDAQPLFRRRTASIVMGNEHTLELTIGGGHTKRMKDLD